MGDDLERQLRERAGWLVEFPRNRLKDGDLMDRAAADLARLRAENEALRTERDNSRANSVSRGKKLLRLRDKLIEISDHIENEGDRAYFGSTNHADELREIFLWLDGFKWDRVMAESDEDDLLSSVERLLARADAAEAKAARLEEAHTRIAGLISASSSSDCHTRLHAALDKLDEARDIARAALEAR